MAKLFFTPDGFDDDDFPEKKLTPVIELPYYDSLRTVLEPYQPADDEASACRTFSSVEIIRSLEEHHGVLQGINGKFGAEKWIEPEDFTKAMTYLGYKAVNIGGLQLEWLVKMK